MQPRFQCYRRDDRLWWRLLGRNNRSLARSVHGFVDLEAAVADALSLTVLAAEVPIELVSESGTSWRWVLLLDGEPRATSTISYARRLECLRAITRFRASVATATVAADPLIVRSRLWTRD